MLTGAYQFGHGVGGFITNFIHSYFARYRHSLTPTPAHAKYTTMTRDDEKMLRAHTGTKPETPIDGASENLVVAPATDGAPLRARVATFFLPCERGLNSHTDVATRPHLSLAL